MSTDAKRRGQNKIQPQAKRWTVRLTKQSYVSSKQRVNLEITRSNDVLFTSLTPGTNWVKMAVT